RAELGVQPTQLLPERGDVLVAEPARLVERGELPLSFASAGAESHPPIVPQSQVADHDRHSLAGGRRLPPPGGARWPPLPDARGMDLSTLHRPAPGVPPWAVRVAAAIPLVVLPSSIWRVAVVWFCPPEGSGPDDLPHWLPIELY